MNTENLQNNLKYFLTDEVKNNQRTFKIVDGTQPLKEAHIFYTGVVTNWGNTNNDFKRMSKELSRFFCNWWAKNRNEVRNYYENKNK